MAYNPSEARDQTGKWTGMTDAGRMRVALANTVTPNQEAAIKSYTGGDYTSINGYLRGIKSSTSESNLNTIDNLSRYLEVAPKTAGITYRGLALSEYDKDGFISSLNKGSIFNDKGFISTTLDKNQALKFGTTDRVKCLITIEGKNGVSISNLSDAKNEREVLFNKSTKMIVKDYKIKTDKNGIFTDIFVTLSEP